MTDFLLRALTGAGRPLACVALAVMVAGCAGTSNRFGGTGPSGMDRPARDSAFAAVLPDTVVHDTAARDTATERTEPARRPPGAEAEEGEKGASGTDDAPELMTLEELEARLRADSARRARERAGDEPSGEDREPDTVPGGGMETSPQARPGASDERVRARPAVADTETVALPAAADTGEHDVAADTAVGFLPPADARGQATPATSIAPPTSDPERVTVSFLDDPLADVLTLFSEYSGLSIIMSNEEGVQGTTITGEIHDQPWHVALETLLEAHGLRAHQDPRTGIITVQTRGKALAEREPHIIRLKYVDAEAVIPTLRTVIGADEEGSNDVINTVNTGEQARNNTLLVYTSVEKLDAIYDMLGQLDVKRPTVTIQAKMVFVNRSYLESMGFSYQIVPAGFEDLFGGGGDDGSGDDGSGDDGSGDGDTDPRVAVDQLGNPFGGRGFPGGGIPGFPGGPGAGGQQGNQATFSLIQRLSLAEDVALDVFFDVMQSTGMAEVEASPVITTTSDLEATINVGEFFILPQQTSPIFAGGLGGAGATQGVSPFGGGFNQFGGNQFGNQGFTQNRFGGRNQGFNQFGGGGRFNQGFNQFGGGGRFGQGGGRFGGAGGGFSEFETGTTLSVTPFVLPNGRVRMQIDISRDGGALSPSGGSLSGTEQSAQTEVTVRNNESIVIGGLTVVEKSTSETGIPVLKELPILGSLFKTQKEAQLYQDLIIVVTPHVIYDPDNAAFFNQSRDHRQPVTTGEFMDGGAGEVAGGRGGRPDRLGPADAASGIEAKDFDCDDFESRQRAQSFYLSQGGPEEDPHGLDADGDGQACEDR